MDKLLLLLCLISSLYGLALIYSATYSYHTAQYVRMQFAAIAIGILLYLIAAALDIRAVARFYVPLFFLNLLLLGSLRFWGVGEGNHGWIRFGGIGIQPAELGKLVFIVSFSGHLAAVRERGTRFIDVLLLLFHAGVTCAFVLFFSRDDGMTLAFGFLALCLALFWAKRISWAPYCAFLALGALPLLWTFGFDRYQRERILAVFAPEQYPDTAYQALQAKHAIASGGLWGKGYLRGTKTQFSLIPTKHTDSIIAVAGEELGFFGCAAVLLLLALITARCIATALRAEDEVSRLAAAGVAGMLLFQTVLNIGMNLGLLPIVGLTLPFFSYGGSSIVTMFAACGIAAGIRRIQRTKTEEIKAYGGCL